MKTLILYYSKTGNTRNIADMIYKKTFSNIEEVNKLGIIKSDLNKYEIIFIGSPIVNNTLSNEIINLFNNYDFTGKRVIPFISYDNRGYSNIKELLIKLCPNIDIDSLLEVYWDDIKERDLDDWIAKNRI